VLGALVFGVAIALAIAVAVRRAKIDREDGTAASASVVRTASVARPIPLADLAVMAEAEVSPARGRAVPADILRTATVTAAYWAPGLALKRAVITDDWESRRAEIEDRTTGDVRAYAIGDLLPHGSLLVGVSTAAAEIMVADTHLVRLHEDGRIEPIQDLSKAFEPAALQPARGLDPDYEDAVRIAIIDLRSDDPTKVQQAIDALIESGDPAVELLIQYADGELPVRSAEYAFPSGSGVEMRPRVSGDVVMMILERITGQTFGDVTKEDLAADDRRTIARSWKRWWGAN
jgi:hypothetical protein